MLCISELLSVVHCVEQESHFLINDYMFVSFVLLLIIHVSIVYCACLFGSTNPIALRLQKNATRCKLLMLGYCDNVRSSTQLHITSYWLDVIQLGVLKMGALQSITYRVQNFSAAMSYAAYHCGHILI